MTAPETKPTEAPAADKPVEERSFVWGDSWPLSTDPVRIPAGAGTLLARRVGDAVLRIDREGTDGPPLVVALNAREGKLRLGHVRRTRPIVLRFPRPVFVAPGATLRLFATYPVKPALFHEAPGGGMLKLMDLDDQALKRTWYGTPASGLLCDLFFAETGLSLGDLPGDRQTAVVSIAILNRSDKLQDVGILLLDPGTIDFHEKEGRLCLSGVELTLRSSSDADIRFLKEPSVEGARLVDARTGDRPNWGGFGFFSDLSGQSDMFHGY